MAAGPVGGRQGLPKTRRPFGAQFSTKGRVHLLVQEKACVPRPHIPAGHMTLSPFSSGREAVAIGNQYHHQPPVSRQKWVRRRGPSPEPSGWPSIRRRSQSGALVPPRRKEALIGTARGKATRTSGCGSTNQGMPCTSLGIVPASTSPVSAWRSRRSFSGPIK